MDEYKLSRLQVMECMSGALAKADGAYGRRHMPRGLWGYWNPEKRERRPQDKKVVLTHDQFIGFRVIKGGKQ